jgi:hypothetical protein
MVSDLIHHAARLTIPALMGGFYMRAILIAAAAALALATTASAAGAPGAVTGPYKLDAAGKCHAANGAFAKQSLCPKAPAPRCKDAKTKRFAKCGTLGAVPA